MRVGSLCSGYGGLELAALELWPDASVAWHAENDPHAATVLAAHWPDVTNLGDLSAADWAEVEPVDVLTAGYPCQPFSTAGRRKGEDDARHLWLGVLRAVRDLRPRLVLLENVAGHLSLGFGRVIGDLAEVGYVGSWTCLRASDVGAPHRRARVFVAAHPHGEGRQGWYGLSATDRRDRPARSAVADAFGGAAQLRRGPRPVARPPRPLEGEGDQRQRGGHPAGSGGQAPADTAVAERRGQEQPPDSSNG